MGRKITPDIEQQALQLREQGLLLREIGERLGFSASAIGKHLVGRSDKGYTVTGGWVINHPYQNELREEERERYLEVIHQRQIKDPNMGWDYAAGKQVSYTERKEEHNRPC